MKKASPDPSPRPSRARSTPSGPAPAGYSGTPLPKKLGIRPGSVVRLLGAPKEFRQTLGLLPGGVKLTDDFHLEANPTLWFIRSRAELERGIDGVVGRVGNGSVWMIWPKKRSGVASDLSEREVREAGLASGLVDYKVCAVDATWSGLLFTRRKGKP